MNKKKPNGTTGSNQYQSRGHPKQKPTAPAGAPNVASSPDLMAQASSGELRNAMHAATLREATTNIRSEFPTAKRLELIPEEEGTRTPPMLVGSIQDAKGKVLWDNNTRDHEYYRGSNLMDYTEVAKCSPGYPDANADFGIAGMALDLDTNIFEVW